MGSTASKPRESATTEPQGGSDSAPSPPNGEHLNAGAVHPVRYCLGTTSAFSGTKVPFQRMRLCDETLAYLQAAPFATASEKNLVSLGFTKTTDYRRSLGHKYYEGYFHSSGESFVDGGAAVRPERSLHPRHGADFTKPAAPRQLHVFCEAFRRANSEWLALLCKNLLDLAPGKMGSLVAQKVSNGAVLADLAVQVHFGEEVAGEDLGWHVDSCNSLLHMAVSVRGRRGLHSMQHPSIATEEVPNEPQDFAKEAKDVVDWQGPGSVYVSCPWALRHSVEYPRSSYRDKVVAVQCRLLINMHELIEVCFAEEERWPNVQRAVTATFEATSLELPSFDLVQEVDAEYRRLDS